MSDNDELLVRKRKALAGSEKACQDCGLKVLASEDDVWCPWCEQKRASQESRPQ